ncbi:hypothetical protein BCSAG_49520 [Bacillus cereus]
MIKVFEMQQQLNNIKNHQSRVVEAKSFQDYLQNVNEKSLPKEREVYFKYVDFKQQTITFTFEHKIMGRWIEFVHFARVIEEEQG